MEIDFPFCSFLFFFCKGRGGTLFKISSRAFDNEENLTKGGLIGKNYCNKNKLYNYRVSLFWMESIRDAKTLKGGC